MPFATKLLLFKKGSFHSVSIKKAITHICYRALYRWRTFVVGGAGDTEKYAQNLEDTIQWLFHYTLSYTNGILTSTRRDSHSDQTNYDLSNINMIRVYYTV